MVVFLNFVWFDFEIEYFEMELFLLMMMWMVIMLEMFWCCMFDGNCGGGVLIGIGCILKVVFFVVEIVVIVSEFVIRFSVRVFVKRDLMFIVD